MICTPNRPLKHTAAPAARDLDAAAARGVRAPSSGGKEFARLPEDPSGVVFLRAFDFLRSLGCFGCRHREGGICHVRAVWSLSCLRNRGSRPAAALSERAENSRNRNCFNTQIYMYLLTEGRLLARSAHTHTVAPFTSQAPARTLHLRLQTDRRTEREIERRINR